jgi:hypothetical protein
VNGEHYSYLYSLIICTEDTGRADQAIAKLQATLWQTSYCYQYQQHMAGQVSRGQQTAATVPQPHAGNNSEVQVRCGGYGRGAPARKESDMAPVMEHGELAQVGTGIQGEAPPSRRTTTLYDLIAAIQDRVSPDDDALVVATVVHLLRSGRLTWHRQPRERLGPSRRETMWAMPHVAPRTTTETS